MYGIRVLLRSESWLGGAADWESFWWERQVFLSPIGGEDEIAPQRAQRLHPPLCWETRPPVHLQRLYLRIVITLFVLFIYLFFFYISIQFHFVFLLWIQCNKPINILVGDSKESFYIGPLENVNQWPSPGNGSHFFSTLELFHSTCKIYIALENIVQNRA